MQSGVSVAKQPSKLPLVALFPFLRIMNAQSSHPNRRLLLKIPDTRPKQCSPSQWERLQQFRSGGESSRQAMEKQIGVGSTESRLHVDIVDPLPFYAVLIGRKPGIYHTLAECEAQTQGFPGSRYQKFGTLVAALRYLRIKQRIVEKQLRMALSMPDILTALGHAKPSELPLHLAKYSEKGWQFSRDDPPALICYTDGSANQKDQKEVSAGLGVWWGDNGDAMKHNLSERVPGKLQGSGRGELMAVIRAVESCPFPNLPLDIRLDCRNTVEFAHQLASGMPRRSKNLDLLQHLSVLLSSRSSKAKVAFKHVRGHSGIPGNEAADQLAKLGALMPVVPDRQYWSKTDPGWLIMTPDELAEHEATL